MRLTARIAATCNRSGAARDNVVGAAAVPVVSGDAKGSGAPSSGRLRATLAVLALAIAAFAITAAPASAATSAEMGTISNVSYTSAQVNGRISANPLFQTTWSFQYCTVECSQPAAAWTTGAEGSIPGHEVIIEKFVSANIAVPRGGTQYFIRLNVFAFPAEANSPAPYSSFTTLAVEPPALPGTVGTSQVFSTSATVTGKVKRPANADPAFDIRTCRFEYVSDTEFTATGFATANPVPCEPATPFTTPSGETNVTAHIVGLGPSTTYHLRLAAENAAPAAVTKEAAAPFTTSAKVAAPTVLATADATEVTQNTAKVSGEVQRPAGADPALDVNCRFEYVSDEHFTAEGFVGAEQTPCAQNPVTAASANGEGKQAVSAELFLIPETTYHFRLAAENEGGVDAKEAAHTFITPVAAKPVVTIDPVASGTYTTAHVSGTITGLGGQVAFQISTDGGTTWSTFEAPTIQEGTSHVEHDFTGLSPNTTYTFRIGSTYSPYIYYEAEARHEEAFSAESSITTGELFAPTTTINPVSAITGTSAHLSATVDPHAPAGPLNQFGKKAFATHWEFVCTPECKDANENVIGGTVQGEEGAQVVGGDAKRLEPNKHYEVTLFIHSEGGEETKVETFDTPLIKPTVKAALGESDGKGGYTLQGVVNPNNSLVTDCKFEWGPNSAEYTFSAPCSPTPGGEASPVTVEAHLTGLTPGATYHAKLVAANGAGSADGGDQSFVPTLSPPETCENEQLRKENSSLALPECRAYEEVSPAGKEGFDASLRNYDGGERVAYASGAGDIAKSGQNALTVDYYVTERTAAGWETIPDLNGSSGSFFDAPTYAIASNYNVFTTYSPDLLSSIWRLNEADVPNGQAEVLFYLRSPDGTFKLIGSAARFGGEFSSGVAPSADLSHFVIWATDGVNGAPSEWGLGVYEFVGTGMAQPRRVDLDNSGAPISTCVATGEAIAPVNASNRSVSSDGSRIVNYVYGGCGGANPPAGELWARVDDTTSFDITASHCDRVAPACNAPSNPTFIAATPDGSRVFFTTTQQLVNGDTDQTNDIYYCDLPPGNPAPAAGKANPCSAFGQISVAETGAAEVEEVLTTSEDGSTVLFTAKGVLASNEDALKEQALAGDNNLYVWHQDSAHPAGQTLFVGRLAPSDLNGGQSQRAQATPDGHYVVFTTANQLVETDTDHSRDVYRVDAESGELTRVSTNVLGAGGNGPFDAEISSFTANGPKPGAISDDGQKIAFITAEALSPLDGNGEPDAYLWTPGGVSLITTGAVGGGVSGTTISAGQGLLVAIDGSGQDIYFQTRGALTPADADGSTDIYDARIDGGFSFAEAATCSGSSGACQPSSSPPPSASTPATARPSSDPGNVKPKSCPKGKIVKGSKCVKKKNQKHSGKNHHGKKASHKQGGGK